MHQSDNKEEERVPLNPLKQTPADRRKVDLDDTSRVNNNQEYLRSHHPPTAKGQNFHNQQPPDQPQVAQSSPQNSTRSKR